ncbi:hypothetical protein [Bacillus fonticola]|uniref:hypothetical protein n=1 Tax=Bacillus fonticola TaxID=2728853 RepID=UPI001473F46E|nr:hypothetical protein [Bacillus fonticola]
MKIFKRNELVLINGTPARFFAQNEQEYLFVVLGHDWKTEKDMIVISAEQIDKIAIEPKKQLSRLE